MVEQRGQGLMIDKLQRWRFDSGSVNEDPSSALKGHTAEQRESTDVRVQGEVQSFGV